MPEGPRRDASVLVIDYGAQYAQLIARRVRECHVYSEIVPHDLSAEEIAARRPAAIVLSGGPKSVHQPGAPGIDLRVFELGIPVLGICYGQQLMATALGGEVGRTGVAEFGKAQLSVEAPGSLLFAELPPEQVVWMSHNDAVVKPPTGFTPTASTPVSPVAAFEDRDRAFFGVQFHPEVIHSERGTEVLKNFLYEGADLLPSWTMTSIIESSIEAIRGTVGSEKIVCALSGGVDSSVAAALVHRAVKDQLTCVFVDHGLLRAGEAEQVEDTFRRHMGIDLIHVKAADRFLENLAGVDDPEQKRKIIGETFIRIFEEVARDDLEDARFLVQGTLYPDVIESGTRDAARIKSHHNVGGLPEDMKFTLVEPLRNLFKDEVRRVGEELGLPEEVVWRQPFPGPGLAVRIIGEVTRDRLELLRAADAVVLSEMKKADLLRDIWQSFAVLPAIRSVGVMGDERTYGYPMVLRAVTSEDAMTADWARLPYELLERISTRVVNEVPGINRVVYDITSKPPGTIEWE
ncbi:MAG: glutamine-hydrolyzing GMP synthase [Actinomycetota bacterium]